MFNCQTSINIQFCFSFVHRMFEHVCTSREPKFVDHYLIMEENNEILHFIQVPTLCYVSPLLWQKDPLSPSLENHASIISRVKQIYILQSRVGFQSYISFHFGFILRWIFTPLSLLNKIYQFSTPLNILRNSRDVVFGWCILRE